MQDSAPFHNSKLVSDFLKKNIKTLDWPGNSPDFNPIENLSAILKEKVADKHPTSAKDMKMTIKCIWMQKITTEYCKHLIHSIPCCLQAVIKSKSGHTKY